MAKLGREVLAAIEAAAERVQYGEIIIHLVDTTDFVDIEVSERIRYPKADKPRAGQIVSVKRTYREG